MHMKKCMLNKEAISKTQAIVIAIILIIAIAAGAAYFLSMPSPTPTPSPTKQPSPTPTVGPTPTPSPSPTPTPTQVAVYGLTSPDVVVYWDPAESFSNEIIVLNNIYERLVHYNTHNDSFTPELATSWKVSSDGLVWTFQLRQGVKFHSGNPFNAESVKDSIERTVSLGMGASYIWSSVEEINIIDDYTVEFKLSQPAPLLHIAASPYGSHIYDIKLLKEKGDDWFKNGHASGTGAYMLEEYNKAEDYVVLKKFDDYWRGWKGKHFDKVIVKSIRESTTAAQMLVAGEVDFLDDLPFEYVDEMKKNPAITVTVTNSFQNLFFFFNTEKPPLDNKLVRQALSYAFPYDDVINYVVSGYASQSRGTIPKGMWAWSEEVPQYSYDLERARQLLADAGYPNGGFKLVLTYNAGDEAERRSAELYKAELSKLRIDLEIRAMQWEQQWDLAKSLDPVARQDIFVMYWWPDIAGDPYTFLYNQFHSMYPPFFNMAYYNNTEFDNLIDTAFQLTAINQAEAKRRYVEAQKMLVDDAPAIFVYDLQYVRFMRSSFKGYVDDPSYPHVVFFYFVWREE